MLRLPRCLVTEDSKPCASTESSDSATLGKLRKKVWINQSDIVLVGLRDYQDAKADVILKYSADEARNLKSYGEFPESVKINETVDFVGGDMDDDIEFGSDVDSDDSGSGDDVNDIDGI